jgi:hypothetical protein
MGIVLILISDPPSILFKRLRYVVIKYEFSFCERVNYARTHLERIMKVCSKRRGNRGRLGVPTRDRLALDS